ncbi:hypothetical protein L6452_16713 [Arctium lappa]|uniref:Uncharacterized protein n=1 Tax=Arctium lappa TaxID=4217 RepID=A0ACB9C1J2_ARCLA|nr:hypothetical protein L6452_16713 [Arctium lappa]
MRRIVYVIVPIFRVGKAQAQNPARENVRRPCLRNLNGLENVEEKQGKESIPEVLLGWVRWKARQWHPLGFVGGVAAGASTGVSLVVC